LFRSLLTLICAAFVVSSLSGCFGMASIQPGECETEAPKFPNKAGYLKEKGAPSSTKTVSAGREVWVYEESVWCGVIPCWGICVPLMLPVCDGFERVLFKGDRAESVHTRVPTGHALILNALAIAGAGGPGIAEFGTACIHRLSSTGPLGKKIDLGRTVALSIGIDTPQHQQDKEFQRVALRLRDVLAWDLVKEKPPIFNEVVGETEPSDYGMEVTLTSATFPGFFSRQCKADMTVRITDNRTNQPLGSFEVYSKADKSKEGDSALESVIENAVADIRGAIIWPGDSYLSNSAGKENGEAEGSK
jgi:hypothetical protein